MKTSHRAVLAAGTAAIGIAGVIGVGGLAQAEPSASASTQPSAASTPQGASASHRQDMGRHGAGNGLLAEQLATKLGLSTDTVRAALDKVRESLRPTEKPATKPSAGERQEALAKALATELKLDQADVSKALAEIREAAQADRDKAFDDRLAKAVTDGKLTQAEADAVKKAADAGVIQRGRGHR